MPSSCDILTYWCVLMHLMLTIFEVMHMSLKEDQRHCQASLAAAWASVGFCMWILLFPYICMCIHISTSTYIQCMNYFSLSNIYYQFLECLRLTKSIFFGRFIIGFFLAAIPWYVGVFFLLCATVDHREKPGLVACTIAVSKFFYKEVVKVVLPYFSKRLFFNFLWSGFCFIMLIDFPFSVSKL